MLALSFLYAHAVATARADGNTCSAVRARDQLWLVSDRGLGCDHLEKQAAKLQYWRYDPKQAWVTSSLAAMQETADPQVNTVVFVHGNRISGPEAFQIGWCAYRSLAQYAGDEPMRFIIWSWPSDAVRGLVNDARVKAWRTDPSGYYLAWFLDRLDPTVPVGLLGHSFGARIITGALHLLGGGDLGGRKLAGRTHEERRPMRSVLVAAALDTDWLVQGHFHGQAMSQTSSMLLVNNGCDAVLKRYHRLYCGHNCAQALGYTGLPPGWLPPQESPKVRQIEASGYVGKHHALDMYLQSCDLVAQMKSGVMAPLAPGEKTTVTAAHDESPDEGASVEELPPAEEAEEQGAAPVLIPQDGGDSSPDIAVPEPSAVPSAEGNEDLSR